MKILMFVLGLFLSSSTFAAWSEDFAQLKDVPRSYEDSGSICEEVARIEMQREYAKPQYEVLVGIAYGSESRVIGELDIVIFDNNLNKVVKIGEVKCWKDMRGGLEKAQEQRARFMKAIRSSASLRFFSTSTKENFSAEQFKFVKEFFSMGQKGTIEAGYDQELPYTLTEMRNYRYEMIRCQNRKECARP
ncbi:MAG: hypothetical protein OM95_02770 [Bdellovibrio sp. ArHS]|uniref:hypothetical protein n=1 Tax=Bdellovibrio sp. ArHS TaxID=1569284 RepID=UPI0005824678|nr:hypothetical protein [Bdellovibrio sp. ArHS]KHD89521.1 MAG: hypothetical protein OM95_02770 [Bdellovibrio sp. ArHS]